MSISLFFGLLSVIFTAFAIYMTVLPFLSSSVRNWRFEFLDNDLRKVELLSAEKSVLVNALRDLEFERQTEKIQEDDYRVFRKRVENRAVRIMKELDQLHGGRGWDERIDNLLRETYPELFNAKTLIGEEE